MPLDRSEHKTWAYCTIIILLLLSSSLLVTVTYRAAFADSYEEGYQAGCYDAGRDYRGLNGHGYDESVHRGDQSFKNGYYLGYRTCWSAESKVTTSVGYSVSYGKGFSEGCYDAGRDFKGLNGHGYDESVHRGDQSFKTGYVVGYRACWSISSVKPLPHNPPPQENWWDTCKSIEWGLTYPCSTYVKPDGSLTGEGKRAKDCISNGGLLAGAGVLTGLPPGGIIAALEFASKLPFYSCDGIVNWQILKAASDPSGFLKALGIG